MKGYDLVSYFTEEQPVKGSREHEVECKGAIFRFFSARNAAMFREKSEEYMSACGGFCSWRGQRL